MDENLTPEVETVEQEAPDEIGDAFDAAFDGDDDDDFDLSDGEDEADEDPDAQPEESEAAEETSTDSESSDESEVEESEAEPAEAKSEGEHQTFNIKVNGVDKQVSLEEMTELAQKGSDYDRVKQERDTFKQDAPTIQKYKSYEEFLKELADSSGTDIESLMDNTRARLLIAQAEEKGEELSEAAALSQARKARTPKSEEAKEAKPEEPAPDPEEQRHKMFLNFLAIYPDVDAKKIPKQVWEESNITGDLVGAYQRYENRELKKKIEKLELNQKNKERSTGSRRTAGATTPKDAFDAEWDD